MLYPLVPFSSIYRAICPSHLSISFPLITFIISSIHITAWPSEYAIPFLLIIHILTFIFIWILVFAFFPFSISVFYSILKLSDISSATLPYILTLAIWLACTIHKCTRDKLPYVNIPIGEHISAIAMLEAFFSFSLISISIGPYMHTISICLAKFPLSNVWVRISSWLTDNLSRRHPHA